MNRVCGSGSRAIAVRHKRSCLGLSTALAMVPEAWKTRTHKDGCSSVSANLACRTASIIRCLRGPREELNEYRFARRSGRRHAFDEQISSKSAHASCR
jgi:hypothetical protein